MGLYSEVPNDGFGFVIVNGVLKACVASGGNVVYSGVLSVNLSFDHLYRCQLNAFEGKIYFYIDGAQYAVLDVPVISWDSDGGPTIGIKLTQSNDGNMYIADLNFSRSLIN